MNTNLKAFLDMLAWSEGTSTIKASDNGYNVLVGGALFIGYLDHPRKLISIPRLGIKSTAAGRYQLLARYFDAYKKQLGLKDFSPSSQDAIAIQQIKERGAIQLIVDGKINQAIAKCSNIWASLPGAGYGQHEHKIADLIAKYKLFGGSVL